MRTTYYANRRGGHCPGHVRDTFLAAIDAYIDWQDDGPEPTVEFEVGYVPRQIPISRACGLVWNCSDTLDSDVWRQLEDLDIRSEMNTRTYAAAARALVARIRSKVC
jgi:hypothetical protein